jgi:hypothetical protein
MTLIRNWASMMGAGLLVASACSSDSDGTASPDMAGQAGEKSAQAGEKSAQAGEKSAQAGAGAAFGGGGGSDGGSGTGWTCASGYDLPSYTGDQAGLCAANESRWSDCCIGPAADVSASLTTRCAPDGSDCVSGPYCTLFANDGYECGWLICDPNVGGAGGASADCPVDKAAAALNAALNGELRLVPCASDEHCSAGHQVCNRRIANRMFCGDADQSAQGGTGG